MRAAAAAIAFFVAFGVAWGKGLETSKPPADHVKALRVVYRQDLIRDRREARQGRHWGLTEHADARTVKVTLSNVVQNGVRGAIAHARVKTGAVIARSAEVDAQTGKIVRFLGNWGFVGRFEKRPGTPKASK